MKRPQVNEKETGIGPFFKKIVMQVYLLVNDQINLGRDGLVSSIYFASCVVVNITLFWDPFQAVVDRRDRALPFRRVHREDQRRARRRRIQVGQKVAEEAEACGPYKRSGMYCSVKLVRSYLNYSWDNLALHLHRQYRYPRTTSVFWIGES